MPIYVSLVNFTHDGLMTMKAKGVQRSDMVKKNVESLGGKMLHAFYCLGEYDVVAILEFPNNRAAMKAAVLNASMGHIRIKTMPAVSRDEWKSVLTETWGIPKKKKRG
ncbi:MAG: GYD domain-containing protein [Nitrospiraceae bacterium]|nr:GYD domain-containing protein [Nitrospira sp.]MCA9458671.1 GYD domain-containing protein [Nitrospira sp.]MCB9772735.1 GYD domain-containing protein [Nitrospiraceae bacterium]MCW5785601.1 GYD domain-containing protein [Nitrospirales bacterium]